MQLNDKQIRFVEEYLIDMNATQAAIRAGYSAKTARAQGARLLTNVNIVLLLKEKIEQRSKRTEIDADWVLRRLVDEAEADMADLYDAAGTLRPVHEWPMIWRTGLVAGMEADEIRDSKGEVIGFTKKIKLSDRMARLINIGRHVTVQAFKDKVEHDASATLIERLNAGRQRVINERG